MKCPICKIESHDEAKFCRECGYDLKKVKGAPLKGYIRPQSYTPKFLADKILTTRSTVEGERKRVTVLFADVANFTSIAEKLDPEEVHEILDGCFKILMDEIHRYEGTINQFRGDGIMALFGAPLAYEDHARRACYAALEIQRALKGYGEDLKARYGLEFKMRVGINSGSVVVGSIGDDLRMDYTAEGDSTNLASRMESMAEPGTILVSQTTYKKGDQHFEFRPLGKVDVKGKKKRLAVYELRGKVRRQLPGFVRKIYSELVGRKDELNRLELHILKVINGEGSIVNVIGEPGIGKSRLIAELKKKESIKRVTLLEGRALAIGKNLSFHPIIDILKSLARIGEGEKDSESSRKLQTVIRRIDPQIAKETFPFIAVLMGIKISGKHAERMEGIEGEALEKLILKSIRDLMIKAAGLDPIVYIIDDLQWSDTTTIEFLESLFRLAENHRILFINVFRPNYKQTGDRLLKTIREKYSNYNSEIYLQAMEKRQCEILINNLIKAKELPGAITELIIKRAEGNPFFIEEVFRAFIDESIVQPERGTFRITDRIDSVTIPETIQDVLMARIDRLDEKTKDLLTLASVIGRNFFHKILAEVAKPIEDIDKKLEYLKEVQLIRERKKMGEVEYIFKHGLTQEAAYESILFNKRKKLHLKVAGAIEHVFSNKLHSFYGILAYHYSNGEDVDKAEEYLLKAGEEALKSSASSEALNYYQEALKLYVTKYGDAADPDKLSLLERSIGLALFNKGRYRKAIKYFDLVLDHWGAGSPKSIIIRTCKLIADLMRLLRNLYLPSNKSRKIPGRRDNEIFDLIQKKAISLTYVDPKKFFIETLFMLKKLNEFDVSEIENGISMYTGASALFSWTGISFKLSKKALEYAKDVVNRNNVKELLYYDLFDLMYNFITGNWGVTKEYDESLLELNLKIGEFWQVATYILFHDFIKIEKGAFEEAEVLTNKLHEIWETYENEMIREYRDNMRIRVLMKSRKLYDAQTEMDACISFISETGRELSLLYSLGIKATIQILQYDIDGAKESLFQAKEITLKQRRIPPHYINGYFVAQLLLSLYLLEESILSNDKSGISKYRKEAFQSGKKALRNSKKYACDRTEVLRLMGLYYWLMGRQNKAVGWWIQGIKEGERLRARVELARTYSEIGKRLLEDKSRILEISGIKGEEYLKKAEVLFSEMGLQWDLEHQGT